MQKDAKARDGTQPGTETSEVTHRERIKRQREIKGRWKERDREKGAHPSGHRQGWTRCSRRERFAQAGGPRGRLRTEWRSGQALCRERERTRKKERRDRGEKPDRKNEETNEDNEIRKRDNKMTEKREREIREIRHMLVKVE